MNARLIAVVTAGLMLVLVAPVLSAKLDVPTGPSSSGSGISQAAADLRYLQLTGGTMTGQQVFSAVTTDISTGTNESLTLAPNGTGDIELDTDGVAIGTNETVASGSVFLDIKNASTSGVVIVRFNSSTPAVVANIGYVNASFPDADIADKYIIQGIGKMVTFARSDDVAAGTTAFEWRDNVSATGVQLATVDGAGRHASLLYGSLSNCSDGAGAAACAAAPAGSVVIDAAATTVVVSTTAVTANSQIFIQEDSSLGTKLSVTCNTTIARSYVVTARTAATSFTITTSAAPVTNPACLSYFIVN